MSLNLPEPEDVKFLECHDVSDPPKEVAAHCPSVGHGSHGPCEARNTVPQRYVVEGLGSKYALRAGVRDRSRTLSCPRVLDTQVNFLLAHFGSRLVRSLGGGLRPTSGGKVYSCSEVPFRARGPEVGGTSARTREPVVRLPVHPFANGSGPEIIDGFRGPVVTGVLRTFLNHV